MKIALIGYGNMGKITDEFISQTKTHKIVSISYRNIKDKLDIEGIKKADVAIDFTAPSAVLDTIEKVSAFGINMVIGTTGWYDKISLVEKIVAKNKIGLIYGKNFSVGANIFFQIVGFASSLFAKYGDYDVSGLEMHHSGKKDSPSGTARKISDIIMKNFPKKKILQMQRLDRQIKSEELHFASIRAGTYFGVHEVMFDSLADEIKLTHSAHNRMGFAEGAIFAADYVKNKKGLFVFEDLFLKQ